MKKIKNGAHNLRDLKILGKIGREMAKHYEIMHRKMFDEQEYKDMGPISVEVTRYRHVYQCDDINDTVLALSVLCREGQIKCGLSWKELQKLIKSKKS